MTTARQVYLYDCEQMLQTRFAKLRIEQWPTNACKFIKRLVSDTVLPENQTIKHVKAVKNMLLVFLDSGSVKMLLTDELLINLKLGKSMKSANRGRPISIDSIDEGQLDQLRIARTTEHSLLAKIYRRQVIM